MRSVLAVCTSTTGDTIEFVEVGDKIGIYVTSVKNGKAILTATIYLSPDDVRALFNWLGVYLHTFSGD